MPNNPHPSHLSSALYFLVVLVPRFICHLAVLACRYMAPELLKGNKGNSSIDVYSFGMLVYELFTGKLPYVAARGGFA